MKPALEILLTMESRFIISNLFLGCKGKRFIVSMYGLKSDINCFYLAYTHCIRKCFPNIHENLINFNWWNIFIIYFKVNYFKLCWWITVFPNSNWLSFSVDVAIAETTDVVIKSWQNYNSYNEFCYGQLILYVY